MSNTERTRRYRERPRSDPEAFERFKLRNRLTMAAHRRQKSAGCTRTQLLVSQPGTRAGCTRTQLLVSHPDTYATRHWPVLLVTQMTLI